MNSEMLTIPQIARRFDIPLDGLRRTLRRYPTLRAHLRRVGATRFLPGDRLEQFRNALITTAQKIVEHIDVTDVTPDAAEPLPAA